MNKSMERNEAETRSFHSLLLSANALVREEGSEGVGRAPAEGRRSDPGLHHLLAIYLLLSALDFSSVN